MFYKGLIFDLDDTLYSYKDCHNIALDHCLNYLNNIYDISYNILKDMYTIISQNLKNELLNTASSHNKSIYFKHLIEKLNIDYSHLINLHEMYWSIFYTNMKSFDHVVDFLKWNKSKNIKIGIVTDYETEYQIIKLKKLNLLEYVDCIVTSEEVGIEKPNSKMFNKLLEKMKLLPSEVIVFGDNYEKDIIGATNLKIKTIFVNNTFSYNDILYKFQMICKDIERLNVLSKYCGERFDLVQAGGGNISVKFEDIMFIKASGYNLTNVNEVSGYVTINNNMILNDLSNNNVGDVLKYNYIGDKRGSIETYMHSILKKYTIHLHPIQINKILISKEARNIINKIYPESIVIDYFTPGIKVCNEIMKYYNNENVIFLLNHGIIITCDDYDKIYSLLEELLIKFENYQNINFDKYKYTNNISKFINNKFNISNVTYLCEDKIINEYFINKSDLFKMDIAFPDALIYCGFKILFGLDNINNYLKIYNEYPKIIIEKEYIYIYSINLSKCKEIEDVLKSNLMILDSTLQKNFLTMDEIYFLNNWDAEKYRKNL